MISDFQISKFRHFEYIELNQLKRVNLFVGKNSAGKSALLEALLLFFTQMSQQTLPSIIDSRQENWEVRTRPALRHLFFNHTFPEYWEEGFSLSSKNDSRSFEVRVVPYSTETEDGFPSSYKPIEGSNQLLEIDIDTIEPFLAVIKGKNNIARHIRINGYGDSRRRFPSRNDVRKQAFFVPTRGVNDEDVATLWDSISLTDNEIEVINGLKLIEPNVEGVAFVGSDNRDRVPLVKIAGNNEPVSLKSLGDGMSRVLQIILSLVNAKDSVLIIDEFENGLHWGVQREVWSLVFRLAARLNVQVFASTHSRDCIQGFMEAWAEEPGEGSFARVERKGQGVSIREYSFDLLSDSLETDVEVR